MYGAIFLLLPPSIWKLTEERTVAIGTLGVTGTDTEAASGAKREGYKVNLLVTAN